MSRSIYIALLFAVFVLISAAGAEERHALVIGNSKYEGKAALRNPVNDVDAIEATLKKLEFKVTKKTDVELSQLEDALVAFRKTVKKNDVALFFYAGHGVQVKGENFLMPINARIKEEFQVKEKCLKIDQVLSAMDDSQAALKIVILDCCRDNPFSRSWTRSAGSGDGLAAISKIPSGTIIAFATAPGETAEDGRGANSPYTTHLIASLNSRPKDGLELTSALRAASRSVKKETGQTPWMNLEASLEDFYLWRDSGSAITAKTADATSDEPTAGAKTGTVAVKSFADSDTWASVTLEQIRSAPGASFYALKGDRTYHYEIFVQTKEDESPRRRGAYSAQASVIPSKAGTDDRFEIVTQETDTVDSRINGTPLKEMHESVIVKPDGIYRFVQGEQPISPPRKVLAFEGGKIPETASWKVDCTRLGSTLKGTVTITGFTKLRRVGYVVNVVSDLEFEGNKLKIAESYSPDLGLVDRVVETDKSTTRYTIKDIRPIQKDEIPKTKTK